MADTKSTDLPRNVKDICGQRFGRLIATTFRDTVSTGARWICLCDCGDAEVVTTNNLKSGMTVSCGCFRRETTSKNFKTHGQSFTREYRIWVAAKGRCFNLRSTRFMEHGGRGITMCHRWAESFEAFLQDMGKCPEGMSIDRIDNNGNYEPTNCRWANTRTQNLNQRRTIMATLDGETLPLSIWAERLGIPYGTLYARHWRGNPIFK